MHTRTRTADPLLGRDPGRAGGWQCPDVRPGADALLPAGELSTLPGGGVDRERAAAGPGGLPAAGDPAAPAVEGGYGPIARGFALPEFSPAVPLTLTLRRPERPAALLAEAMLAAGILRESDWQGSLAPSIGAGLTRWLGELLGGQDLRRIEIGIYWTDSLQEASDIDPALWFTAGRDRVEGQPVGLLALQGEPAAGDTYPHQRDCIVGETVLELEAARKNLGFQILALLQDVLPMTLCAATPHWGWDQALKGALARAALGSRGALLAEPAGLILPPHQDPDGYRALVPPAACEGEFRPGVLKEALKHSLPEPLYPLVKLAREVADLWRVPKDVLRWDTHSLCPAQGTRFIDTPGVAMIECPFALRWSADDPLPALVDHYHHTIRKHGEQTNLIWSQGWQAASPPTITRAVRNFARVVPLALKACQLAELMHREPRERVRLSA